MVMQIVAGNPNISNNQISNVAGTITAHSVKRVVKVTYHIHSFTLEFQRKKSFFVNGC